MSRQARPAAILAIITSTIKVPYFQCDSFIFAAAGGRSVRSSGISRQKDLTRKPKAYILTKLENREMEQVMSSKILVIISTGEAEKAATGLMYARNAIRFKWMDEVEVIFFGPSERLLVEDEKIINAVKDFPEFEKTLVCKFLSDRDGISEKIGEMGLNVDYVGPIISGFINEGYIPLVF